MAKIVATSEAWSAKPAEHRRSLLDALEVFEHTNVIIMKTCSLVNKSIYI